MLTNQRTIRFAAWECSKKENPASAGFFILGSGDGKTAPRVLRRTDRTRKAGRQIGPRFRQGAQVKVRAVLPRPLHRCRLIRVIDLGSLEEPQAHDDSDQGKHDEPDFPHDAISRPTPQSFGLQPTSACAPRWLPEHGQGARRVPRWCPKWTPAARRCTEFRPLPLPRIDAAFWRGRAPRFVRDSQDKFCRERRRQQSGYSPPGDSISPQ